MAATELLACAFCGKRFIAEPCKHRHYCSQTCASRGKARLPLTDKQRNNIARGRIAGAAKQTARHQERRRPTDERRQELIRQWILDMRANEKRAEK